jgi:cysteine synthase A
MNGIRESVLDCIGDTPLVRLRRLFSAAGTEVVAKLETLNPGGSIKDRPARHIVECGLRDGTIHRGTRLVESTSGNLGVALATVSRVHGLRFTAVVDPYVTPASLTIMRLLGAGIETVTEAAAPGGFPQSRANRVRDLLRVDPTAVWVEQYACARNLSTHFHTTGDELIEALDGRLDLLAVPIGSGATLMGTARRLRMTLPHLTVVGVDMVGSTLFGGPAGERTLPGAGPCLPSALLEPAAIDRVVYVTEAEAVAGCRRLLTSEGILAGPSSGSVIAAISAILPSLPRPVRIATVLPDRGERYLHEIFGGAPPSVATPVPHADAVQRGGR